MRFDIQVARLYYPLNSGSVTKRNIKLVFAFYYSSLLISGSAEQLAGRTLFSTHWIAIGLSSPAGQDWRGRVGESLSFYSCLRMPLMEGKEKEEECEITGVWDCGSPLYDSFELVSLSQLLDRNMMGMAMPGSSSEAGDSISTTSMKVDLAGCTGTFKTDTGDPAKRRRRRRDKFKNKIRVGCIQFRNSCSFWRK